MIDEIMIRKNRDEKLEHILKIIQGFKDGCPIQYRTRHKSLGSGGADWQDWEDWRWQLDFDEYEYRVAEIDISRASLFARSCWLTKTGRNEDRYRAYHADFDAVWDAALEWWAKQLPPKTDVNDMAIALASHLLELYSNGQRGSDIVEPIEATIIAALSKWKPPQREATL